MVITTNKGTKHFKYTDPTKPIRYLGSWSTADMEDKEGVEKLKDKVKTRMGRIEKLRATPHTKALLMKARVLSVINYTGSIQTIPEVELDKWEKQIYKTMTKGQGCMRRDLVYEKEEKGGMGMTHVKEEYKTNRIRGLIQMVETEDRQAGRKQVPWIQRKILKDLQREQPYLSTVREMKHMLQSELQITVQQEELRYQQFYCFS